MRGSENIEKQIGRRLTGGLIKSLYEKGEVVDLISVSFLKFENEWLRIVCTDEQTTIKIETTDIERYNLIDGDFEFRVRPVNQVFPAFEKLVNKKLIEYKELVHRNSEFMSFGLNLRFEDNLHFIIRKHDYPRDENEFLFDNISFDDLVEK